MEKSTKLKILESLGKIYEKTKRCKLEESFFSKMDTELSILSSYFHTTNSQSLFIAIVFAENFKGNSVDFSDLIRHLDCNPMKLLEFSDDFSYLCASGIFKKHRSRHRFKLTGSNDQFTINEQITEAILNNKPMPEITDEKILNVIELLEKIYIIGEQCYDEEITTQELFNQTRGLILNNLQFPLIRNINHFKLEKEDSYLYLYLIFKSYSGSETIDLGRTLNLIFDKSLKRFNYMQEILSGENTLIKNKHIEIVDGNFFNKNEIKLSDNSYNLLKECDINLFANKTKKKNENILSPTDIPFRELIFCDSEMQQLFMLKGLLNDTKFKETQERLTYKNLPKGVTVLLHGAPGTGKTEIVKQVAKETNRELMRVEISQSKSMWFGESEKIIKRIFTDYRAFAKECKQTPILLFNEADAIFSKRREIGSSNLAQTENAIQNIILEEMESFDGILMATTNLADNLDSAFERRFLFKIKFQKPDSSIRARIWKSKLPNFEIEECEILADRYDFTGGQIDNVLRKNEIYEIIHGEKVTLENLMTFCDEETLSAKITKVGFVNSA